MASKEKVEIKVSHEIKGSAKKVCAEEGGSEETSTKIGEGLIICVFFGFIV